MRALILSCHTGQGHTAAGYALSEALQEQGVQCELQDALAFQSARTSKAVSSLYAHVTTRAPRLFGLLYRAAGAISSDRRKSVVYLANRPYVRALHAYIEAGGFDFIVVPHLFPAEALTYIKKHMGLSIPCFGVQTDYTCIPFWEETELDAYVIAHMECMDAFVRRGLPREKLVALGIPVQRRFVQPPDAFACREQLGFAQTDTLFLVMTGSMGFGDTHSLVEALLQLCTRGEKIVVLCGHNEKLRQALCEAFGADGQVQAHAFTQKAHLYMRACDVLLTKPGGLTSTEAAVMGVPLVHTQPIPGCETQNVAFFTSRGMSISARTTQELAQRAYVLAYHKDQQAKMLRAQRTHLYRHASEDIARWMLSRVQRG